MPAAAKRCNKIRRALGHDRRDRNGVGAGLLHERRDTSGSTRAIRSAIDNRAERRRPLSELRDQEVRMLEIDLHPH